MLAGRKYRLDLTPEQTVFAQRIGDACRAVWNTGLEQRREYRRRGAYMNYVPQAAELVEAKREFPWLADVPGHCLQQTLMDLDRACREHGTWKVRWRGNHRWRPSFRFPEGRKIPVERLGRKAGRVRLPKLGWVRFRWSRALGGAVRSATVSFDAGHWWISFLVDDGVVTPERPASTAAVGVDRGVVVAVATSDGELHDQVFRTGGEAARYRRLQQRLARQQRGSSNRRRTITRMGRVKRRERDRRTDFCAQAAASLTRRYGLVTIEKLNTRGMTGSAKGTLAEPGRNVRQKAGLNRAILDKGWHRFELALRNAARYTGTIITTIDPAYTSQTCSACGHVDRDSRESQAEFRCTACGHTEHADVNAAKNINAAGRKEATRLQAVSACGDLGVTRSVKQELEPTREEVALPPVA